MAKVAGSIPAGSKKLFFLKRRINNFKVLVLLGVMDKSTDKGKLANLVKETEKALFKVNRELKSFEGIPDDAGLVFQNVVSLERASGDKILSKELSKHLREQKIISQCHELFKRLESLRRGLDSLVELEEKARFFVERNRTARLYEFEGVDSAIKFARQALEVFSAKDFLFKPRYVGTVNLGDLSKDLQVKLSKGGLLLQDKDVKPFVKAMSEKKFASNISFETSDLKLVWQDKRTISVDASSDKLYRLDRICDVLHGKCLEK